MNPGIFINKIQSILPALVPQNNFITFAHHLPLQNAIMEDKTILRVPSIYSLQKKIVKISSSSGLFLDDEYYQAAMGEDKRNKLSKSYPVDVYAIKINWLLKDQDDCGRDFLQELYKCENLDIFRVPSIIMIIEFFYSHFKKVVIYGIVPINLLQALFFYLAIVFTEASWTFEVVEDLGAECTEEMQLEN